MTRPTLTTARIELVPLADNHLELEVELDSDPEVLRYLYGKARKRAEVEESHRHRIIAGEDAPGLGFWVGFVGGPDQPRVPGEADLGYRLLSRWWRRGLAREGSRELLRYGFLDVGLHRIFAQTMAANEASRAVMASIGMTYVRTFAGGFPDPLPGSEQGEVEYAVTRDQWQSGR